MTPQERQQQQAFKIWSQNPWDESQFNQHLGQFGQLYDPNSGTIAPNALAGVYGQGGVFDPNSAGFGGDPHPHPHGGGSLETIIDSLKPRNLGIGGGEVTPENPQGQTGLAADPAFWNRGFTGGHVSDNPNDFSEAVGALQARKAGTDTSVNVPRGMPNASMVGSALYSNKYNEGNPNGNLVGFATTPGQRKPGQTVISDERGARFRTPSRF